MTAQTNGATNSGSILKSWSIPKRPIEERILQSDGDINKKSIIHHLEVANRN
jgi:hypothetical protein